MPATDHYKTLGVSREASADEIRKAYKKLARKHHPDVSKEKDASEQFKQVQEAYDVLGDAEKRRQYDQFGAAFNRAGGPRGQTRTWGGPGGGWTGPAGGGGPVDFGEVFGGQVDLGDLLGGMFGGGAGATRQGRRARKGPDLQTEVEIPFQTAVEGGDCPLQLDREGRREKLTIKVPAGVDSGSVIRLAGQGQPGAGGPAGDLLVTIRVAPHPYFRREGNNLLLDLPLTITEATLGAKVEVPTLSEGKVMLTVPAGTSSGAKLRLRGKGVVGRETKQRGDQLVVIKIVVPAKPSARARQLLDELAEAAPQTPRAGLW